MATGCPALPGPTGPVLFPELARWRPQFPPGAAPVGPKLPLTERAFDPLAPRPWEAGLLPAAPKCRSVRPGATVGGAPRARGRVGRPSLGGKCAPHPRARGRWAQHLYLQEPRGKSNPRPAEQFRERGAPGPAMPRSAVSPLPCEDAPGMRGSPSARILQQRLRGRVRCTPTPPAVIFLQPPFFLQPPLCPLQNCEILALTWKVCCEF